MVVIIVKIIFIGSFFFYCLLYNHSFQTNPNSVTNCFKLILFYLQLYQLHLLNAFVYFDFWTDVKFPDEVETPIDVPARVRFAKYRGLKSFRSSPWDPKESLPLDYSYVFQLSNYTMLQKSETTRAEALSTALQKSRTGK